MKKLAFLLIAVCFVFSANAQEFEGTILFDVKMSGKEVDKYAKAFPEKIQLKIKGQNMRGKTSGGQITSLMSGFIFDGDHKTAYVLSDAFQTAFKLKSADFNEESKQQAKFNVEATGETKTIVGYNCKKYIGTEEGKDSKMIIWATEDFTVTKPTNLASVTGNIFVDNVPGLPLMVTTTQNETTIEVAVSEIRKEGVDASSFEIPSGYRVQDFDFNMFNAMLPGGGN